MHNIQTSFIRNNHHFYSSGADYQQQSQTIPTRFQRPHISLCSDDFLKSTPYKRSQKSPVSCCTVLFKMFGIYGNTDAIERLSLPFGFQTSLIPNNHHFSSGGDYQQQSQTISTPTFHSVQMISS